MKYMGSKSKMLEKDLGHAILSELSSGKKFHDMFSGSGAVSWFAAENADTQVLSSDLQKFCAILAGAVIERDVSLNVDRISDILYQADVKYNENLRRYSNVIPSAILENRCFTCEDVILMRQSAELLDRRDVPIASAYGGHYFSLAQALWFDAVRSLLHPENETAELASVIMAASRCCASPGHTAQPFSPYGNGLLYINESWRNSARQQTLRAFKFLSNRHAIKKGAAFVRDAGSGVSDISDGDLVFVDPPYSGVHYSRFYHVLESVARGRVGSVSGVGRYPPKTERPQSQYSLASQSFGSLDRLLRLLSNSGARVILTFPAGSASNGLTGKAVFELAEHLFSVKKSEVITRFSTLGGDKRHRSARVDVGEMLLVMYPK